MNRHFCHILHQEGYAERKFIDSQYMNLFTILRSMLCILKEAKVNITFWAQVYMVFIESLIPKIHFLPFVTNRTPNQYDMIIRADGKNNYQKRWPCNKFLRANSFHNQNNKMCA